MFLTPWLVIGRLPLPNPSTKTAPSADHVWDYMTVVSWQACIYANLDVHLIFLLLTLTFPNTVIFRLFSACCALAGVFYLISLCELSLFLQVVPKLYFYLPGQQWGLCRWFWYISLCYKSPCCKKLLKPWLSGRKLHNVTQTGNKCLTLGFHVLFWARLTADCAFRQKISISPPVIL